MENKSKVYLLKKKIDSMKWLFPDYSATFYELSQKNVALEIMPKLHAHVESGIY